MIASIAAAWLRRQHEVRLRRDLRAVLKDAGIDEPIPTREVCRRIGLARNRPIIPVEWPFEAGDPYGAWCPGPSTDWIFVQKAASFGHQEHIVAHELGHLLAGHEPECVIDGEDDDQWPGQIMRRTKYDSAQERDAETVATLLLQAAAARSGVVRPSGTDRARTAQHALGDGIGWL